MAAPSASARGGISLSNSSFDFRPRPPETTLVAVARSGRSDLARSSDTHSVSGSTLGSTPSVISADPPSVSAAGKAVPRTVIILMLSVDWTVRAAFPAYMGRTKARGPERDQSCPFGRKEGTLRVFSYYLHFQSP